MLCGSLVGGMAAGLAFLHSFESISPYHSNEPPLKYFQACLLQRTKKFEKPLADPIVFFSLPISSLTFRRKIAEVRGRQRSTHLSGIAENINLFVVTIGKVCKQQAGGLALQRRLSGRQAGKQCNNAKCQVCLHSECGQRRAPQKAGGDTQRRTPISCFACR